MFPLLESQDDFLAAQVDFDELSRDLNQLLQNKYMTPAVPPKT